MEREIILPKLGTESKVFDMIKNSEETINKFRATPAARRLIREEKIDVKTIIPTGPKGRIQLKDVNKTISMIKAKGYAPRYEPIVVETKLDTLIGHPQNTRKISKIFRVAKGQSLKKLLEDEINEEVVKKEMIVNPNLDFVPFVENGVAELREEIIVKPTPIINGEVGIIDKDQPLKEDLAMEAKIGLEKDHQPKNEIKQARVIRNKEFDQIDEKIKSEKELNEVLEKEIDKSPRTKRKIITKAPVGSHLENATITLTIEIEWK